MTSLLNLWGPPAFPMSEKDVKKFCPRCKHPREWKRTKTHKICKTCGAKVKLSK